MLLILFHFVAYLDYIYCSTVYSHGINLDCDYYSFGIANSYSQLKILNDGLKNEHFPTALYINKQSIKIGWIALEMLSGDPENVFLRLPCMIDETLESEVIQQYLEDFPYHSIIKDNDTNDLIILNQKGAQFRINDLISLLLNEMMDFARQKIEISFSDDRPINFNPRTIVLTIPSYYHQNQRKTILKICEAANITVIKIVEPAMAALHGVASKLLIPQKLTGIYGIVYLGYNYIEMIIADFQNIQREYKSSMFDTKNIKVLVHKYSKSLGILKLFRKMKEHFINKAPFDRFKDISKYKPHQLGKFYRALYHFISSLSFTPYAYKDIYNIDGKNKYHKLSLSQAELKLIITESIGAFVSELIKFTVGNTPGFWLIPRNIFLIGHEVNLPYLTEFLKMKFPKYEFSKSLNPVMTITWSCALISATMAPGLFHKSSVIQDKSIQSVMIELTHGSRKIQKYPSIKWINGERVIVTYFNIKATFFNFGFYYLPQALSLTQMSMTNNQQYIHLHDVRVKQTVDNDCVNEESFSDLCVNKGIRIKYNIDQNNIIQLESVEALFIKKKQINSDFDIIQLNITSTLVSDETAYSLYKYPYHTEFKKSANFISVNEAIEMENMKKAKNLILNTVKYQKKERARNELFHYIYDFINKFNNLDYIVHVNETERDKIWSFLQHTNRWLKQTDHHNNTLTEYIKKFDVLIELTYNVENRVHEKKSLPILEKRLRTLLQSTQKFILNMMLTSSNGSDSKQRFTRNETKSLRQLNKEIKMWYNNYTEKTKDLKLYEDGPIKSSEMIEKIKILDEQHKSLIALWQKRLENDGSDNSRDGLLDNEKDNRSLPCSTNSSDGGNCVTPQNGPVSNGTSFINSTSTENITLGNEQCTLDDDKCPLSTEKSGSTITTNIKDNNNKDEIKTETPKE